MKGFIILMVTLFMVTGCSDTISKDFLQANPWIGDLRPLVESMEAHAPESVELIFHDDTLEINLEAFEVIDFLMRKPDEEEVAGNPLSQMIVAGLSDGSSLSAFSYELNGNTLTLLSDIEGLEDVDFELTRTMNGFSTHFQSDGVLDEIIIEFSRK